MVNAADPSLVLVSQSPAALLIALEGNWDLNTIMQANTLKEDAISTGEGMNVQIDLGGIGTLDTSGALIVCQLAAKYELNGSKITYCNASNGQQVLLNAVSNANGVIAQSGIPKPFVPSFSDTAKERLADTRKDIIVLLSLLGALSLAIAYRLLKPSLFRPASIVTHMHRTGLTAVPIICLMSFLIGAIVAQQGAYQLSYYGAELLAIDLVGVLVTRDVGVLLTAIMVAGRSGSAYTAEIGAMKMREEIDALKVIGLDPLDVLIFPRVFALILVLPILTVIADLAAMLGAAIALNLYIDMSFDIFWEQTRKAVTLAYFLMGIVKAPFMAAIIGIIAVSEGLKVGGSTESLGNRTTTSVVKGIFLVIVVDGIFAIVSASLGY